jgi:hypothetical protein
MLPSNGSVRLMIHTTLRFASPIQLVARRGQSGSGGAYLLRPGISDVNLFRYGKGIIDLNAEVPDSAFDLCVPE